MMKKLGTLLNRILCKPHDVAYRVAGKVGMAIGHFLVEIIFVAMASVVILAAGVSALLLWMSVPYFACMAIYSDDINSIWQVYAMFGIFGAWAILSKFLYDILPNQK